MTSLTERYRFFREKAEEIRVVAEGMSNAAARQAMIRLATSYEALADQHEKEAAGYSNGPQGHAGRHVP